MSLEKRYTLLSLLHPVNMPDYLRHKAPVPPPEHDPDEPPFRCLYINREYIPFILAVLDYYRYPDQFIGTPEELALTVERFTTLQTMFMMDSDQCEDVSMLRLRQNLMNPCLLEYSIDAGVSYQTAFDYSQCARRNVSIDLTWEQLGDTYISNQTTMNTYNGDIVNVAPEWNYGDEDDAWRDMALCWAAEGWVEACADLAILAGQVAVEERQNKLFWVSAAFNTLGDVASALADMEIYKPQAEMVALVAETAAHVVTVVANLQGFDPTSLSNQTAQTIVACVIYNALAGSKPTFSAWSAALLSHGLTGDEGVIADAAYLMMQSEEVFVQYLMLAADVVPAAELAGDLGCPCDDVWQIDIDCKAATLPGYATVEEGTHYPNVGIIVEPYLIDGIELMEARLRLTATVKTTTLTDVLMEYGQVDYGQGSSGISTIVFEGHRDDPPEYFLAVNWTRSQVAEGSGSKQSACDVTLLDYVEGRLNVSYGSYEGMGAITRIRLCGSGQNPFTA